MQRNEESFFCTFWLCRGWKREVRGEFFGKEIKKIKKDLQYNLKYTTLKKKAKTFSKHIILKSVSVIMGEGLSLVTLLEYDVWIEKVWYIFEMREIVAPRKGCVDEFFGEWEVRHADACHLRCQYSF